MFVQLPSASWTSSQIFFHSSHPCPKIVGSRYNYQWKYTSKRAFIGTKFCCRRQKCSACALPSNSSSPSMDSNFQNLAKTLRAQKLFVVERPSDGSGSRGQMQESLQMASNFTNFQEDPMVDKLQMQLGRIHPIPSPPINRKIVGLFTLFFFVGVIFDKFWMSRKKRKSISNASPCTWLQVPANFPLFLEKDLQRKESVEWVNMVLGKLWKVYRAGIENWIVGLVQPAIDNLKKPDYVQRVEIKQFSLGDEPLSVRNVERKTSRRADDLQYHIGLRYTGGACLLLSLYLKFGIIPIVVPFGVRDFDIDGEIWIKLRLIPSEPWVGVVSWAFVSLPKIKIVLSPFRLFNLMAIPVLSMFLTKLLTEDLPRLFVLPKKTLLDFQRRGAVGSVPDDFTTDVVKDWNKDFVGELSVTLVDAQKLPYIFYGKTDPYVVLRLGDQVYKSKKNSQTTIIGPPGEPIWNQDFLMLVADPKKQKLCIQVRDAFGLMDFTIGTAEVALSSLQDTVPSDKIVDLQGGWGIFRKRSSGEILLRLTYKAYVEDEEDCTLPVEPLYCELSNDASMGCDELAGTYKQDQQHDSDESEAESVMDVLLTFLLSEEFQEMVTSETGNKKSSEVATGSTSSTPASAHSAEFISVDSKSSFEAPRGSALLWLAVITCTALLISVSIGGSSLFNP